MKSIIGLLILLTILLAGCQDSRDTFPNALTNTTFDSTKRVIGTRFFASVPDSYTHYPALGRFEKDSFTYLNVIEMPNTDFYPIRSKFENIVHEHHGKNLVLAKPIKYNHYDGYYLEEISTNAVGSQIMLCFGDESFTMMVTCVYKSDDLQSRNELIDILKSSSYKKGLEIQNDQLQRFEFDSTITGFRFVKRFGNMTFYSENGNTLNSEPFATPGFQLSIVESQDLERVESLLNSIEQNLQKSGINFLTSSKRESTKNSNSILNLTHQAIDKNGVHGYLILAAIFDPKKQLVVIFLGSDKQEANYVSKYEETIESVEINK